MDFEDTGRYDDIIGLPHHVSAVHPQMPRIDRAAQFGAFSPLRGHKEALQETALRTAREVEEQERGEES